MILFVTKYYNFQENNPTTSRGSNAFSRLRGRRRMLGLERGDRVGQLGSGQHLGGVRECRLRGSDVSVDGVEVLVALASEPRPHDRCKTHFRTMSKTQKKCNELEKYF